MTDFSPAPQPPQSIRDVLVGVGKELISHGIKELARVPLVQYGPLPPMSYQPRPAVPPPPPQLGVTTGCASCDIALMLAGAERYLDHGQLVLDDPNLSAWYVNHARGFLGALQTRLKTITGGPLADLSPQVANIERVLAELTVPYQNLPIVATIHALNRLSHQTFSLAEGKPPAPRPIVAPTGAIAAGVDGGNTNSAPT